MKTEALQRDFYLGIIKYRAIWHSGNDFFLFGLPLFLVSQTKKKKKGGIPVPKFGLLKERKDWFFIETKIYNFFLSLEVYLKRGIESEIKNI